MGRESIISAISERLKKTGISHSLGNGSDMAITAEFLDAGWSTGSKKITYEALVLADEATETVFF